jgi:hypothetical protein
MSTARNTHLSTRRRSTKSWEILRAVSKRANMRPERQKKFRYHHYA